MKLAAILTLCLFTVVRGQGDAFLGSFGGGGATATSAGATATSASSSRTSGTLLFNSGGRQGSRAPATRFSFNNYNSVPQAAPPQVALPIQAPASTGSSAISIADAAAIADSGASYYPGSYPQYPIPYPQQQLSAPSYSYYPVDGQGQYWQNGGNNQVLPASQNPLLQNLPQGLSGIPPVQLPVTLPANLPVTLPVNTSDLPVNVSNPVNDPNVPLDSPNIPDVLPPNPAPVGPTSIAAAKAKAIAVAGTTTILPGNPTGPDNTPCPSNPPTILDDLPLLLAGLTVAFIALIYIVLSIVAGVGLVVTTSIFKIVAPASYIAVVDALLQTFALDTLIGGFTDLLPALFSGSIVGTILDLVIGLLPDGLSGILSGLTDLIGL